MKFSELIERVKARGVVVGDVRTGLTKVATPWSDGSGGADPEITSVCDDSRKIKAGDLFVARVGSKADGAKFIVEALNRRVAAVVGEMILDLPGIGSAEVEDANLACAILAHEVAGNPTVGMKMIGITGTKGKTTVAYLMRSVLQAAGYKVGMIGTVEIDDGKTVVPAEMTTPGVVELVEWFCRMRENGVTHCVMEVSSHALHQKRVAGIDWAVAIFTNLTGDHLDYHKTMEEYAAAKAILFEGLKEGAVAVVNIDDPFSAFVTKQCRAEIVPIHVEPLPTPGTKHLTSPRPPENGWAALVQGLSSDFMRLHVREDNSRAIGVCEFNTPMIGRHNAYNLLCVIAAAAACGVAIHDILGNLKENTGAPGRLQPVIPLGWERKIMPFQVFVDYAHTHDALENVLTALRATMRDISRGPSAGGMLLTPGGEREIDSDTNDSHGMNDPSPRQKHGTHHGSVDGTPMPRSGRLICVFGCGGDRDRTKRPKMGAVAEKLADVVIVTSDNPRTEDAAKIIEEICAGFSEGWREAGKISVEPDRRAAIKLAIGMAEKGDVVLIAGKGHENYQIIGTTKHHFDDVEEAENALRERFGNHDDATARRKNS